MFNKMNGIVGVSKVIQDSFIDVNEKGTESAAVTVVVFTMKSIFHEEPDVFKADHPFIFIIKDNKTDLILFVGKFAGK